MDTGSLTALIVAAVSAVTAAVSLLRGRRKDAIGEWETIVDRLEKQNEALAKQNADQQSQLDAIKMQHQALMTEHNDCRNNIRQLWSLVVRVHDYARRQAEALTKLGHAPEAPPDLPEMKFP